MDEKNHRSWHLQNLEKQERLASTWRTHAPWHSYFGPGTSQTVKIGRARWKAADETIRYPCVCTHYDEEFRYMVAGRSGPETEDLSAGRGVQGRVRRRVQGREVRLPRTERSGFRTNRRKLTICKQSTYQDVFGTDQMSVASAI